MIEEIDLLIMGFQKISIQKIPSVSFPKGIRYGFVQGNNVLYMDKWSNLFLHKDNEFVEIFDTKQLRFLNNEVPAPVKKAV